MRKLALEGSRQMSLIATGLIALCWSAVSPPANVWWVITIIGLALAISLSACSHVFAGLEEHHGQRWRAITSWTLFVQAMVTMFSIINAAGFLVVKKLA